MTEQTLKDINVSNKLNYNISIDTDKNEKIHVYGISYGKIYKTDGTIVDDPNMTNTDWPCAYYSANSECNCAIQDVISETSISKGYSNIYNKSLSNQNCPKVINNFKCTAVKYREFYLARVNNNETIKKINISFSKKIVQYITECYIKDRYFTDLSSNQTLTFINICLQNDKSVHITFINNSAESYTAENIYTLSISYKTNYKLEDSETFEINSDEDWRKAASPGFYQDEHIKNDFGYNRLNERFKCCVKCRDRSYEYSHSQHGIEKRKNYYESN